MSRKPQFDHKIPRFFGKSRTLESALRQRRAPSYNAAIVACACVNGWNAVSAPGLRASSVRGAAGHCDPEGPTVRQMEILQ
jgi:hypothetical protein